jgi:hypothetical protein
MKTIKVDGPKVKGTLYVAAIPGWEDTLRVFNDNESGKSLLINARKYHVVELQVSRKLQKKRYSTMEQKYVDLPEAEWFYTYSCNSFKLWSVGAGGTQRQADIVVDAIEDLIKPLFEDEKLQITAIVAEIKKKVVRWKKEVTESQAEVKQKSEWVQEANEAIKSKDYAALKKVSGFRSY